MYNYDRAVEKIFESLASVTLATADLSAARVEKGMFEPGARIMRAKKFIPNFKLEFDPKNVFPPVHVLLADTDDRHKIDDHAEKLSKPDNIVLIVGYDAGFTPRYAGKANRTEMMSTNAILHRWGHNLYYSVEPMIVAALKAWIDNDVDLSEWFEVTDKIRQIINKHNLQDLVAISKKQWTEKRPADLGGIPMSTEYTRQDGQSPSSLFAVPCFGLFEFIYNMFTQFGKFGKITLRGAPLANMLPYTSAIAQMFVDWVDAQKGKIIWTAEQY